MPDVSMPSYLDYGKMMEMNPVAQFQAQQQQGLAQQFAQQRLQQEQEQLKTSQLANQFSEQDNPLRIQSRQADIESKGYENRQQRVKTDQTEALAPGALSLAQQKQVLEADEGQIKHMQQVAQQYLYDDDPETQRKGRTLLEKSKEYIEMRQKHKDEMEKQDLIRKSAEKVAGIHAGATIQAAQIGAESRFQALQAKSQPKSPAEIASKLGFEKGAVYWKMKAIDAPSGSEEAKKYEDLAEQFEQANLNQKSALSNGKIDPGALTGLPTQKVGPALGGGPKLGTAENPIVLK